MMKMLNITPQPSIMKALVKLMTPNAELFCSSSLLSADFLHTPDSHSFSRRSKAPKARYIVIDVSYKYKFI